MKQGQEILGLILIKHFDTFLTILTQVTVIRNKWLCYLT